MVDDASCGRPFGIGTTSSSSMLFEEVSFEVDRVDGTENCWIALLRRASRFAARGRRRRRRRRSPPSRARGSFPRRPLYWEQLALRVLHAEDAGDGSLLAGSKRRDVVDSTGTASGMIGGLSSAESCDFADRRVA